MCLTLALLSAGLWLVSAVELNSRISYFAPTNQTAVRLEISLRSGGIVLSTGGARLSDLADAEYPRYFTMSMASSVRWWPEYQAGVGYLSHLFVPLWIPTALFAIPLPPLLWCRRRPTPGQCRHCLYNLRGLPSDAPCPECGKGATA